MLNEVQRKWIKKHKPTTLTFIIIIKWYHFVFISGAFSPHGSTWHLIPFDRSEKPAQPCGFAVIKKRKRKKSVVAASKRLIERRIVNSFPCVDVCVCVFCGAVQLQQCTVMPFSIGRKLSLCGASSFTWFISSNPKSKIDLEQILFVCITTFSISTNAERKWPLKLAKQRHNHTYTCHEYTLNGLK